MLSAVSLDDKPSLEANEVGNVVIDRHLAFELETFQLFGAQELPEPPLSLRCA